MASIAYLMNQYPSPSHTFIRREIVALNDVGIDVHRFSHRVSSANWLEPADWAERQRTTVLVQQKVGSTILSIFLAAITKPIPFSQSLATALWMGWRAGQIRSSLGHVLLACVLGRLMRTNGVEHVHAHMATNPTAVAMFCRRMFGFTYSFTAHSAYEYEHGSKDALDLDRKIAGASFVIAVSEHGSTEMQKRVPRGAGKIHLIPCGLDDRWLNTALTPIPTTPRFLSVGRLHEHKDPLLLIRAAAALRDRGVNFHLTIVGDGPLRSLVERESTALRLAELVTIAGWQSQDQIMAHLQQSRTFLLSSRTEGLPIAIMEAFAAGRPVIAPDVAGIRELVIHGKTGWLVRAGDCDALVDAMQQSLRASVDHLRTLAISGRHRVVDRYNIQLSAAALAALLRHPPKW